MDGMRGDSLKKNIYIKKKTQHTHMAYGNSKNVVLRN